MTTVTIKRSFCSTDLGAVRRGQVIETSELIARSLVQRGLAAEGGEKKDAPGHPNKMAPSPKKKSDDDETDDEALEVEDEQAVEVEDEDDDTPRRSTRAKPKPKPTPKPTKPAKPARKK